MIINHASFANQGAPPTAVRQIGVALPKTEAATFSSAESRPLPEQLQKAVSTINQAMHQANQGLEFSFDADTNMSIVKIVDTGTGEVIRQIPSEEVVAIAHAIDQFQQGLLLRAKA